MATKALSQAEEAAALLTKASEALVDACGALIDARELTDEPDGEPVPLQEALALVGLTAAARRHAAWTTDELGKVERAMLNQYDLASERGDDAR